MSLQDHGVEIGTIRELHQIEDSNIVFTDKCLKESIKELKEKMEKINHGIMSASQWMVIKETREIIDDVFGRRLAKQRGNDK
ncbi:hypothetical protein LCGC14_1092230 [marine sediment metagenome]|uniref:Uncharacterized protein n=1 Tax=marine sediment metagenome TaxID=412755 RepID=A0A0F9MC28_9ZZZZ